MRDSRIHRSAAFAIAFIMVCVSAIPTDGDSRVRSLAPETVVTIHDVDDLNLRLKPKTRFHRSMIPAAIARLEGKRVRIYGDMFLSFRQDGLKAFVLGGDTKGKRYSFFSLPVHCGIIVRLRKGSTTSYTRKPIVVEGRMTVRPVIDEEDGTLYYLYELKDATVRTTKRRAGYHPSTAYGC